ncbi:MAG: porphobilinogen synthase [Gammaproteobacteria bacterium]|nr:porphobilinogen synthase [Gammaproteobacteria bacterium]
MQINLNNYSYPTKRMRRLRTNSFIRDLVQENNLNINDLIYPVFIHDAKNTQGTKQEITSMPGQYRYNLDGLLAECEILTKLKIPAIALFPSIDPELKTINGLEAANPNGLVPKAIAKIKQNFPHLGIISDIALDPYTSHGQDGILDNHNKINNDETLKILVAQAITHAEAGADILAPSDMMDGRIGIIRQALEQSNFPETALMSYAAKFVSNYYGPFRDAVNSKANLGTADKKTYQINIANSNEALHEVALDIQEGADMVIVKPGGCYLDIVYAVNQTFKIPTFAYQVSGEYTMQKLAFLNNLLDQDKTILETLMCFKRAGCAGILTYFAKEAAALLTD